jgi:hypothetical protein
MSGKPLHADDTAPLAQLIVDLCSKIVSPSNPVGAYHPPLSLGYIRLQQGNSRARSGYAYGLG